MDVEKFQKLVMKNNDIDVAIKYNNLLERMSRKDKKFNDLMIGGFGLFRKLFKRIKGNNNYQINMDPVVKSANQKNMDTVVKSAKQINIDRLCKRIKCQKININNTNYSKIRKNVNKIRENVNKINKKNGNRNIKNKIKKHVNGNRHRLGIESMKELNKYSTTFNKLIKAKDLVLDLYKNYNIEYYQDNKYIIYILIFYLILDINFQNNFENYFKNHFENLFLFIIKSNYILKDIIEKKFSKLLNNSNSLIFKENSDKKEFLFYSKDMAKSFIYIYLEASIFYVIFNDINNIDIEINKYINKLIDLETKDINYIYNEFIIYYLKKAFFLVNPQINNINRNRNTSEYFLMKQTNFMKIVDNKFRSYIIYFCKCSY